jgi:small subunit ribosomal protein S20
MANLQASIKANRQNKRRRVFNQRIRNRYRKAVKKFKSYLEAEEFETAREYLPRVYKLIDKAAKRGVINDNKASRDKSRLTLKLNNLSAPNVEATNKDS